MEGRKSKSSPVIGKFSMNSLGALDERVADLERKLRAARAAKRKLQNRVAALENWTAVLLEDLRNIFGAIEEWANGVDAQLKELDDGYRNLSTLAGANDTGPFERPLFKTGLGILVDRGGAVPVDGNAAGIFRGPMP